MRILTEVLEAKDAIFCLDDEMEGFVLAVREDDLDTQSDKELLDLFCQLAHHRNTTPLVKDWVKILRDDYDRCVLVSVFGWIMLSRLEGKRRGYGAFLSTGTSSPTSKTANPSRRAWIVPEYTGTAAEQHRMGAGTALEGGADVSDLPRARCLVGRRHANSRGGKATAFAKDTERYSIC